MSDFKINKPHEAMINMIISFFIHHANYNYITLSSELID
ncbi:hypothetical protein yinte0001_34530 [Yersinia intermedia ATCC 29909]|nr:hypothetical protein yinte0001_34530 [Yersinia intermedia ATCC 29909]